MPGLAHHRKETIGRQKICVGPDKRTNILFLSESGFPQNRFIKLTTIFDVSPLLLLLGRWLRNPARHAAVHVARPGHGVRGAEVEEGGLLEKSDREVKLFGDALGRHVTVARPDDVLDVQAIVLVLIALPDSNLGKKCR